MQKKTAEPKKTSRANTGYAKALPESAHYRPAEKITTRRARKSVVNREFDLQAMKDEDARNRSFKYTARDLALAGVSVAFIYSSVWLAWLAR